MSKSMKDKEKQALENLKFSVANELGVSLKQGYNGDLTTRQCGGNVIIIGRKKGGSKIDKEIRNYILCALGGFTLGVSLVALAIAIIKTIQ